MVLYVSGSIEVLPKCIESCSFSEMILVLFSSFNCVEVIFKVRKVQYMIFQVTFDLGLPLKVKYQGHKHFKGLCLINGVSYDQIFMKYMYI